MDENPIQPPVRLPIQPSTPVKPNLKFPLILLAATGLAIAGYFASAYYFQIYPFEQVATPIQTFTPRPSPTLTPTPSNKLENWRTYQNQKYGFDFRYPGDFNQIDSSDLPYLDNNHGHILLSIIDGELDSSNIQDLYGRVNPDNIKPIIIGNQTGYSYNSGDGPCGSYTVRTKLSNTKHLMIRFASCTDTGEDDDIEPLLMENENLIDQILSTFTFTE